MGRDAGLAELARSLDGFPAGRSAAVAALAERIARGFDQTLIGAGFAVIDHVDRLPELAAEIVLADELIDPTTLGLVYELLLADDERRTEGAHYTPPSLAAGLIAAVLDGWTSAGEVTVLDPSCGGGAFLLAAGAALVERTNSTHTEVARQLMGRDLDPLAVQVTELAIALWCVQAGEPARRFGTCETADSLQVPLPSADLIVGNPPFLSQLASSTARSGAARDAIHERFGELAGPYADTAAYFLAAAGLALRPGGRMVLIQPQSVLSSRDVVKIRQWITDTFSLDGFWYCEEPVFAASVRVCAPIFSRSQSSTSVSRWVGPEVEPASPVAAPSGDSWGPLVADLIGVPNVWIRPSGNNTVGSLAAATAGFRDQFYGFAPHTSEAAGERGEASGVDVSPDRPAAVTVGMIDVLRLRWGTDEFRYAGTKWTRPVVDLAAVAAEDASLHHWAIERLRPKVVLATQTKVIEVAVDTAGTLLPITPVVSVEPHADQAEPDMLWRLAAALSSPPLSAWAITQRLGSALSVQALKLAARDVEALPLPTDSGAWSEGAVLARAAHNANSAQEWTAAIEAFGQVMARSYGVADETLLAWWTQRLPGWR